MEESAAATVAQSAGRFTVALVIQRLVAFVYFSYAAVRVGPESLGSYVLALNLAMAVGAVADLGLANVLTREAARASRGIAKLYGTTLVLKIGLVVAAYLVLQVLAGGTLSSGAARQLVWGTGVAMVLDALTLLNYALVRAQGRLQMEGWGSIASQLAVALAGVPLLLVWPYAGSLVAALLVGSVANLAYSTWLIAGPSLRVRVSVTREDVRWIAAIAWPFALSLVLTRLYGYADGVAIGWLGTNADVGLYGLPSKLTTALQFLPLAFIAALYPAMSSAYGRSSRGELSSLFHDGVRYLWLLGVGAAACIGAAAGPFIHSVYGAAYRQSIPVLGILMLQVPFLFVSFPLGALLNACDRQRRTTVAMGVAVAVDLGLLVALYPSMGISGAAAASVASTIALVAVQLAGIRGLTQRDQATGRAVILTALAGLVSFTLGVALSGAARWWLALLIAGFAYICLSFLSGTLTKRDVRRLASVARRP